MSRVVYTGLRTVGHKREHQFSSSLVCVIRSLICILFLVTTKWRDSAATWPGDPGLQGPRRPASVPGRGSARRPADSRRRPAGRGGGSSLGGASRQTDRRESRSCRGGATGAAPPPSAPRRASSRPPRRPLTARPWR